MSDLRNEETPGERAYKAANEGIDYELILMNRLWCQISELPELTRKRIVTWLQLKSLERMDPPGAQLAQTAREDMLR